MFDYAAGAESLKLPCDVVPPARPVPTLIEDARRGLLALPRTFPAKYLYDELGSRLFDRICETPEYYPTRTEEALLASCAHDVILQAKPGMIFEIGSGTSRKTRCLIDACEATEIYPRYTAFDISEEAMQAGAAGLSRAYDWLEIELLRGDYEGGFATVPDSDDARLFVFLGSTIGNFEHDEAVAFLADLRNAMAPRDRLLLGADRVKDPAILNAAYNDNEGITEAFNTNLLRILNRELAANFEIKKFRHQASYVEERQRIEMHLVSQADQEIYLGALDTHVCIRENESIRTEISRKFTLDSLDRLVREAGFAIVDHYEADQAFFSLILAKPLS